MSIRFIKGTGKSNRWISSSICILAMISLGLTACNDVKSLYVEGEYPDDYLGEVYVYPTNISDWEDYRESLQPKFSLTADGALAEVLATTMGANEASVRYRRVSAAAGLPSYSDASNTVLNSVTDAAGQSTVTGTGQSTQTLAPGTAPDLAAARGTPPQATLPAAGQSLSTDAMMRYWSAAALYQEVQLLNRMIKDATALKGYKPYIVRLQVSTMPYSRMSPVDTYISFSAGLVPKANQQVAQEVKSNLDQLNANLTKLQNSPAPTPVVSTPLARAAARDKHQSDISDAQAKVIDTSRELTKHSASVLWDKADEIQTLSQKLIDDMAMSLPTLSPPEKRLLENQLKALVDAMDIQATHLKLVANDPDISNAYNVFNKKTAIDTSISQIKNIVIQSPMSVDQLATVQAKADDIKLDSVKTARFVATSLDQDIQIIPLLVTDNLEMTAHNRSARDVRDTALALQAMVQNAGLNLTAQSYREIARSALGQEYNSLLMVTKSDGNALRVRIGALNNPVTRYSMVPRNHQITFLMLVNDMNSQAAIDSIRFAYEAEFRDAITGNLLDHETSGRAFTPSNPLPMNGSLTPRQAKVNDYALPVASRLNQSSLPATVPADAVLLDSGKTSQIKLFGGSHINTAQLDAWLEIDAGSGKIARVAPAAIATDPGGVNLSLTFPSLLNATLADGSSKIELKIKANRLASDTASTYPLKLKTLVKPSTKTASTLSVSGALIVDKNGEASVPLTIKLSPSDGELKLSIANGRLSLQTALDAGKNPAIESDGKVVAKRNGKPIIVDLKLQGLLPNRSVELKLIDASNKKESAVVILPVTRIH